MDELDLLDPAALQERLNEWQQSVALAIDALKQVVPEVYHGVLDTIEACHADSRAVTLAFQEAYVAERALFEKFAAEMLVAIGDLRGEIAQQRSSQPERREQ